MKLCKSPYPPLHCHNASKVKGGGVKAGDMSSLIESEDGTSDLCSAPSKGYRNGDKQERHQLMVQRQLPHNPKYHLSLASWFPEQPAGV